MLKEEIFDLEMIDGETISLDVIKKPEFTEKYLALKKTIDFLEEGKKKVDEKLKEVMREEYLKTGEKEIKGNGIKITYIDESFRNTFNTAGLKVKYPEIYKEFATVSTVSESIRITTQKRKGDE